MTNFQLWLGKDDPYVANFELLIRIVVDPSHGQF